MPLHFIRHDITKVKTDAIVLPANNQLRIGSGASESIYEAAGRKKLEGEINLLYPDGCEMGKAVVTHGYDRPAKWIIHAVCPQWQGGELGEADFLYSAYRESLLLAKEKKCASVAFPLLSTGSYMYPRMQAISIAVNAFMDFLAENEMEIILVLFEKEAVRDVERLFGQVESFLEDGYTDAIEKRYELRKIILGDNLAPDWYGLKEDFKKAMAAPEDSLPIYEIMDDERESFLEMLTRLIEERGMTDPEVYKAAGLTKQNFSKIRKNENYTPKKKTILALAFALHLNTADAAALLRKAGYTLSDYYEFDRVMKYCLDTREFDFETINEHLLSFGLEDDIFRIKKG